MHLIPPLLTVLTGACFILLLSLCHSPSFPTPYLVRSAKVKFPGLVVEWAHRVVGFVIVGGNQSDSGSLHVGWMGNGGHIQQYAIPLEDIPLNNSQSPPIEANLLSKRTIPGQIVEIASQRHRNQDAMTCMAYRVVKGEDMWYEVDALDMSGVRRTFTSEEELSPSNTTSFLRHRTWQLPGSLPPQNLSPGRPGRTIMSRRHDSVRFRLYDTTHCGDEMAQTEKGEKPPCVAKSIPGPLKGPEDEQQLVALELYSSRPDITHVFSVTYVDNDASYRVTLSIFTYSNGSWSEDVVWNRREIPVQYSVYSPVLGHEVVESDGIEGVYWLSKPLIALSPQAKTLAWIFLGRVFTLDYQPGPASAKGLSETRHGYVLQDSSYIHDVSVSSLRIKAAQLNRAADVLAVVNDGGDIMTFRRPPRTRIEEAPSESNSEEEGGLLQWWFKLLSTPYVKQFMALPNEVDFFWDGNLETTPITVDTMDQVAEDSEPEWSLEWMWEAERGESGETIVGFNLVDSQDLPQSLVEALALSSSAEGDSPSKVASPSYIFTLYYPPRLILLDLTRPYIGSHFIHFLKTKWFMLTVMSFVVALFTANEVR
ncbi:hypothetical protein DFS34DRAFT_484444 [Phlyctochytrium arcticum]|nr:hypothetical protein DFS34DRAFT_484444 [Phlyctochytrium arcticum]